jgi:hypothetical protein
MTPAEYDPCRTFVELLFLEASEIHADQILVISRSEQANLYFVSENRIIMKIRIQAEFTPGLLNQFFAMRASRMRALRENSSVCVRLARDVQGTWEVEMPERRRIDDVNATVPISGFERVAG